MNEDRREPHRWQSEPDDERLAELVGEFIAASPDHAAWSDDRFLSWLATRDQSADTPEALSRAGMRLVVRTYCRRLGVTLLPADESSVVTREDEIIFHVSAPNECDAPFI